MLIFVTNIGAKCVKFKYVSPLSSNDCVATVWTDEHCLTFIDYAVTLRPYWVKLPYWEK